MDVRRDFGILKRKVHGKPLVYLDSAASSLMPDCVLDAVVEYYKNFKSNVHRGVYSMSEEATEKYEGARKSVALFLGADEQEIIFTRGTTESLNVLARSLMKNLEKGDEVVLTEMEHHSNLVPWQQLAQENGVIVKFIRVEDGRLDMDHAKELIGEKTKVVSVVHMSNVLGTINDVTKIAELAHAHGALCVVDGAQSVVHLPVDVKELDCDFFVCSGHKMMGPTGVGVLYGKKELLEAMEPFSYGGEMVLEVDFDTATWNELPYKFEAGTPPIAQAIGLGKAVEYLQKLSMQHVQAYDVDLTAYALETLGQLGGIQIHGPLNSEDRGGVISFTVDNVHAHDVATVLDQEGVAMRAGHQCTMPLVKKVLGVSNVCRVSFSVYTTKDDVDALVKGLKKVKEMFTT